MLAFFTRTIALLSLAAVSGAAPAEHAPSRHAVKQEIAREAFKRGDVVPLKQILRAALAREPGDVAKVELEIENQRLIYEIKILRRDGAVRELLYDARTGTFLGLDDD